MKKSLWDSLGIHVQEQQDKQSENVTTLTLMIDDLELSYS
jgi:hypothetical protein